MPGEIIYSEDARTRMLAGVDALANTVKFTLGPRGRYVIMRNSSGAPAATNHGATIARELGLPDPVENMGLQLIKEVVLKTKDAAGDGTTTSAILAQALIREGFRNMAGGANPVELKKGIQGAAQLAVAAIRKLSKPVEGRSILAQVAATSAGDAEIGEMIADAVARVGADGVIQVDESRGRDTTLVVKEGMQLDVGYLSPEMATDRKKMIAELDHPLILITDKKISDPLEIAPLLEQVARQARPLLIIAEAVEAGALGMLLLNKAGGMLNAVAIYPPAYGDGRRARMEDLTVLTGATFITEQLGHVLSEVTLEQLGSAASVQVSRKNTVIVGGAGAREALIGRMEFLRSRIEKTQYDFDREQYKERLARLGRGVAIIHAGAATEIELKEKKIRIENAISAVKGAAAEGILPGGGAAYLCILPALRAYRASLSGDMKTGAAILIQALQAPARQIAENAGVDGAPVVARIMQSPAGVGFNVLTKEYGDMIEAGIVDSARVVRLALQSAASVSAAMLTIEAGVMDTKK